MTGDEGRRYDEVFFDTLDKAIADSAAIVVPLVCGLLRPSSVLDVGCGRGLWLQAFKEMAVTDVRGIDGTYVRGAKLAIAPQEFTAHDLRTPLTLDRTFELALCLEVLEHLPRRASERLLAEICRVADAVVFSAAIPGQGGRGHVNEQPPSFWYRRFAVHDFVRFDALRPRLIADPRVAWWYRQNIMVYVRRGALGRYPELVRGGPSRDASDLEVIQGRILEQNYSLRGLLRLIPGALQRALVRRFGSGRTGPARGQGGDPPSG